MKVTVRNLGIVTEAKIDLKPLTIFVGPNNSGKTWVAYALSGILGQYGWEKYTEAYTRSKIAKAYPELKTAIDEVLENGNAKIDMVQFAKRHSEKYFNNVARQSKEWMADFINTTQVSFEEFSVRFRFVGAVDPFVQGLLDFQLKQSLSYGRNRRPLINAIKDAGDSTLYFYTEGDVLDRLPSRVIRKFIAGNVFQVLQRAVYADAYAFPTERTTYITFPFARALQDDAQTDSMENTPREHEIVRVPEPVSSFLSMVGRIHSTNMADRREEARNDSSIRDYIRLAQLLETSILKGHIDLSTSDSKRRREITYQPNEETRLEMPVVSSMVKELSPLALYLRYEAEPGELVVIDEPEMNLHPEAQVQLMEFLAMLVNAGLHVLFTTHSSYMIDHLVNLMQAAEHANREQIAEIFFLQDKAAFISQENVSVFFFDDHKAKNILHKGGLIEWGTFSRISDRISEINLEL